MNSEALDFGKGTMRHRFLEDDQAPEYESLGCLTEPCPIDANDFRLRDERRKRGRASVKFTRRQGNGPQGWIVVIHEPTIADDDFDLCSLLRLKPKLRHKWKPVYSTDSITRRIAEPVDPVDPNAWKKGKKLFGKTWRFTEGNCVFILQWREVCIRVVRRLEVIGYVKIDIGKWAKVDSRERIVSFLEHLHNKAQMWIRCSIR